MKRGSTALAGAIALAFAQGAFAQVSVQTPDIRVEQQGVQNSQQIGSGNQSSQAYGERNQQSQQYGSGNYSSQGGTAANEQNRQYNSNDTYQRGGQNQNAYGSGNQQNQQYGSDNRSMQNHDRYGASGGATGDGERHDKGKHKGWYKHDRDDRQARGDDDHRGRGRGHDDDDRRGRRGGDDDRGRGY